MVSNGDLGQERGFLAQWLGNAGIGAVRVALLFGTIAVSLALIIAPIADKQSRQISTRFDAPFGIDPITTASTKRGGTYTLRRSVLQASPRATCIISVDGRRSGSC